GRILKADLRPVRESKRLYASHLRQRRQNSKWQKTTPKHCIASKAIQSRTSKFSKGMNKARSRLTPTGNSIKTP
ncbi:MAG: hypothetical protein ACSHXD_20305, partial [Marinosulfonomonas sp.]